MNQTARNHAANLLLMTSELDRLNAAAMAADPQITDEEIAFFVEHFTRQREEMACEMLQMLETFRSNGARSAATVHRLSTYFGN